MSRRQFLRSSAAVTAAAGMLATGGLMADPLLQRIGVQLYTLRDALAADFAGTLRRLAAIGYREVEFAGYYGRGVAEIRDLLAETGLQAPSTHVPLAALHEQLEQTLETALAIGHRYIVLPWLDPDQRQTIEQYAAHAEFINQVGARCRSVGIHFAYHNHDFEFQALSGKLPYDLLLEETDPTLLSMELDLYWINRAGYKPGDYFGRYPGRFSLCHVKDMAPNGEIADVGSGTLDFATMLCEARDAGVNHFFVEHDQPTDAFKTVAAGYRALIALGN